MPGAKYGCCCLCQRECPLTFHHLVPRKLHRRTAFRKKLTRAERNVGIDICRLCHRGLHDLHDEMTLGKELNTLEALRADPQVQRHVNWVRKQPVRGRAL